METERIIKAIETGGWGRWGMVASATGDGGQLLQLLLLCPLVIRCVGLDGLGQLLLGRWVVSVDRCLR